MIPDTLKSFRRIIAKRLNFNVDTANQDFTGSSTDSWAWIDDAINEAYVDEINEAVLECSARPFTAYQTFTWPSGDLTYELPPNMDRNDVLAIFNITGNVRGAPFSIGDRLSGQAIVWRTSRILEWGTTGPGQDTSLAFQYVVLPEPLQEPDDVPTLIPARFRYLLVWSALIILRDYADEAAPKAWLAKQYKLRAKFHKYVSTSAPTRGGQSSPDAAMPYQRSYV